MMVKLSKAQREVLRHGGGRISFVPRTGNAWTTDAQGFTIRVRPNVFNALTLNGAIVKISEHRGPVIVTHYYELTDAGRVALNEEVRKP
jgi:hypothetical protein